MPFGAFVLLGMLWLLYKILAQDKSSITKYVNAISGRPPIKFHFILSLLETMDTCVYKCSLSSRSILSYIPGSKTFNILCIGEIKRKQY